MTLSIAFVAGLVFAAGLGFGGMTQPAKVLAFLDVFGRWDPSLAFVMGGAILVHAVAYAFARRRVAPLAEERFHVPTKTRLDKRLIVGASLFGLGWGIAGYCPGPALASAASGSTSALILVAGMLAGMWLEGLYESASSGEGRRSLAERGSRAAEKLGFRDPRQTEG